MSQALGNSSEQSRKKPGTHLPYKSVVRGSQAAHSISRVSNKLGRDVGAGGEIAILSMITREGLTGKRCHLNEDLKEMLERVRQISTRLFEKRMFYKGIASTMALRGRVAGTPMGQQDTRTGCGEGGWRIFL